MIRLISSSRSQRRWRQDDHLSLVAGISKKQRAQLEDRGTTTLEALAQLPLPLRPRLESVSDAAFEKIHEQARIQLEGRLEDIHKYELFTEVEEGNGLLALPEPSKGDVFFDIEGDPHAFDEGLEYLLGYVDVEGEFTGLWALTPDEERAQFEAFIDMVMERLERWPDLHVYHYAAYEQTAMKRLAARYATREEEVDRLLRSGAFVDLYRVVRQGLRASVESYSIKKMEPLYRFDREVDLRVASAALANFEAWLELGGGQGADELLHEIDGYNKDDCVSTLRLRDWLEGRRVELSGLLGRELERPEPAQSDPSEKVQEESERVQQLFDALTEDVSAHPEARAPEEHARWILAQLLSWHRREKKSMWWEYFRLLDLDDDELLHDSEPLAGLKYVDVVGQVKKSLIHRYSFPQQDFGLRRGDTPRDPATERSAGEIVAINDESGTIDIKRSAKSEVPHPVALIPFDDVPDQLLRESLWRLADDVVENGLDGAKGRAAADLLLRRRPRVGQSLGEPLRQPSETNLEAARRIALSLDDTVLPIQHLPVVGGHDKKVVEQDRELRTGTVHPSRVAADEFVHQESDHLHLLRGVARIASVIHRNEAEPGTKKRRGPSYCLPSQLWSGTESPLVEELRGEAAYIGMETPGLLQEEATVSTEGGSPYEMLQRRHVRARRMHPLLRLLQLLRVAQQDHAVRTLGGREHVG